MIARRVGTPAVPFDLADSRGHRHRLDDFHGRFLLMVFHRHLS
jgi:hypothetical protein